MKRKRRYRKEHGSFYFYENGRMQLMADSVGLCFSVLDGRVVLHKHGEAESISSWCRKNRRKYRGLFGELYVVESREWDPEALTECLERPHKIAELLQSVGWSLPTG